MLWHCWLVSGFNSRCWILFSVCNQPPKTNAAFHPSRVGKWVPALAGKAKAGMDHSVSGWTRGVQVKQRDPLRTRATPECHRVCLRQGTIQIHIYLILPYHLTCKNPSQIWPIMCGGTLNQYSPSTSKTTSQSQILSHLTHKCPWSDYMLYNPTHEMLPLDPYNMLTSVWYFSMWFFTVCVCRGGSRGWPRGHAPPLKYHREVF